MFPVLRTSLRTTGFITLLVLAPAIALAAGLTITPIPLQTFAVSEDTRTITVEASNPGNTQLTYSARIVSFGHAAGLVIGNNNDYRNWGGLDEKWVLSKDNSWYFITPDGSFYQWNKSPQGAFTTGPVIGKFPPSFHADLSLLINQPDQDARETDQFPSQSNGGVQTAGNVFMNGDQLTVIVGLGLKSGGNDYLNWGGLNERWLQSKDNTWYFIKPDGSFYRWNKSPQHAFTTGPVIAKFPPSFHTDLSLLINRTMVTGSPFGVEVTVQDTTGNKAATAFGVVRLGAGDRTQVGNLFITKSSTPVRSRQLLGGTLTDEILRLQFYADKEDIDVTDLVVTSQEPDESLFASNVDRIELYKVGSTTPFATATVGSCGTDPVPSNSMCAKMKNREFIVPKGSNTNILLRARMRTDTDGAVSGKHIKLRFDAIVGTKARGLASSINLAQNNGNPVAEGEIFIGTSTPGASQTITSNDNVVVLSKITSITNVSFDANGTAIPIGFARQIGQFKFSAVAASNLKNGQNKWTLTDVIFTVTAPNVQFGSGAAFKIFNKADEAVKSSCVIVDHTPGSPVYHVACWDVRVSSVNTEIDPGSDTTFVLQADIVNAKVNNSLPSSLQVSLQRFSDPTLSGMSTSQSHIRWLDKDNGGSQEFWWIEYPETKTTINGPQYQS